MEFKFGKFNVDIAIPNRKNPKTIIEIKVYTDAELSLMLHGLFCRAINSKIKIGLVTLYDTKRGTEPELIIKDLKKTYGDRFEHFHLENGWSNTIKELIEFCSL